MHIANTAQSRPALVEFPSSSAAAGVRLVSIAHAGAGAAPFSGWNVALPDSISVIGVRLPGREGRLREVPLTSIEDMAEHIIESLSQDCTPIALFGHCFGGCVAFRIAQLLEQASTTRVVRLIAANATAPGYSRVSVRRFNSEELFYELVATGAVEDNPQQRLIFELMEPTIRADFNALEDWHRDDFGKISAPILAIRGAEDHLFETADNLLWRNFTIARFSHSVVPGGHFLLGSAMPGLITAIGNDLTTEPCPS